MQDIIAASDMKRCALRAAAYHHYYLNHTDAGWLEDTFNGIFNTCSGERACSPKPRRQFIGMGQTNGHKGNNRSPVSVSSPPAVDPFYLVLGFLDKNLNIYFVIDKKNWIQEQKATFPIYIKGKADNNLKDLELALRAHCKLIHTIIEKGPHSGHDYFISFYRDVDMQAIDHIFSSSSHFRKFIPVRMDILEHNQHDKFQSEAGIIFSKAALLIKPPLKKPPPPRNTTENPARLRGLFISGVPREGN